MDIHDDDGEGIKQLAYIELSKYEACYLFYSDVRGEWIRQCDLEGSLTGDQERQAKLAELEENLESVVQEMWGLHAPSWTFALGRIHISLPVNSQRIAQLFVLYNLVALISGILLILLGKGLAPELGIALVVGALFSIGAFASAVWILTVEGERVALQTSFGADMHEHLQALRFRRDALIKEIEALNAADS